ncbi:MAG: WhiB family transcriptional regulator [Acidimicrobiia bacterium]
MSTSTAIRAVSSGQRATADVRDVRTWAGRAACAGRTSLFFESPSERPEARRVRELKASMLCAVCPVMGPCRAWARTQGEYGYWGGESEEQRALAGFGTRMPRPVRQPRRVGPHRVA